jgi:hypothetical protein
VWVFVIALHCPCVRIVRATKGGHFQTVYNAAQHWSSTKCKIGWLQYIFMWRLWKRFTTHHLLWKTTFVICLKEWKFVVNQRFGLENSKSSAVSNVASNVTAIGQEIVMSYMGCLLYLACYVTTYYLLSVDLFVNTIKLRLKFNILKFAGIIYFSLKGETKLSFWSSRLWQQVVLWSDNNVSEEHAVSVFRIKTSLSAHKNA